MTTWNIQLKGKKITKKDLKSKGIYISDYAEELLNKCDFKTEGNFELVVKTVAELGLKDGGTFEQITEKAKDQGLELCPPEVGPALRLAYIDQPKDEWLRIAMEPITGSVGFLLVFFVGRDVDGLCLRTLWFFRDFVWFPDGQWVFVRKVSSRTLGNLDSQSLESRIKSLESDMAKIKNLFKYEK